MNCKQFNTIRLEAVLLTLGHLPIKQNEKEAWYLNPFGIESQASFKVDKRQNLWFLFSEGCGGNNTDFIKKYFNCSVSQVLEWASGQNFSSFHPQKHNTKEQPDYRIDKITDLKHPNLLQYLLERGLSSGIYSYIKEVWFTIKDKPFYAIGFENRSNGWELRNPYYKGALLKKDLSLLSLSQGGLNDCKLDGKDAGLPAIQQKNLYSGQQEETLSKGLADLDANKKPDRIAVFEGFMDMLSFIELQKSYTGDVLVLNSITFLGRAMELLLSYSEIHLFLDNDAPGIKSKNMLLNAFPQAQDHSSAYLPHKDLNEYLMHKKGLLKAQNNTPNQVIKEANERKVFAKNEQIHNKKRTGRRM